jgi:hypothetical protein
MQPELSRTRAFPRKSLRNCERTSLEQVHAAERRSPVLMRAAMLWTVLVVSSDFVASGFQSAYRRRPDRLTPGGGVGGAGH